MLPKSLAKWLYSIFNDTGEQIMSQLTGFGHQSMAHHFQQMESGNLQHQHNIHQLMHQNQMSSHPHQGSPQPQRHNLHQPSSSPFPNPTGGGVPYVKIVEQPAGNKLRFRYIIYIDGLCGSNQRKILI